MSTQTSTTPGRQALLGVIAWAWVAVPFSYGLYQLIIKIPALFGG